MRDFEIERTKWLKDRPFYENFGNEIANKLRKKLQSEGIYAQITSRAKDVDSLIRKLIKKPNHTYETIGDKAGVRIILRYKSEIEIVQNIVKTLFASNGFESKLDLLGLDQVGYLSVHGDVKLLAEDDLVSAYPAEKFHAELQIRTLAQHLWSEISHDAFYKNDESLNPISPELKRRVYLLAGVVEVADNEFDRLNTEMTVPPEFEILKSLERNHYKLTTRRIDPEISLNVIRILLPLYKVETQEIINLVNIFFNDKENILLEVFDQSENDPRRSSFLFQPEIIMIYERLVNDSIGTKNIWEKNYPLRELEKLANSFGLSFD